MRLFTIPLTLLVLLLCGAACGQSLYSPPAEDEFYHGRKTKLYGYSSLLADAFAEDVTRWTQDFLRNYGKLRPTIKSPVIITDYLLQSPLPEQVYLYGMVAGQGQGATVYIGADASLFTGDNETDLYQELHDITDKLLRHLHAQYLTSLLQQAEEELRTISKYQNQLERDITNLNLRLENNRADRSRLEQALEKNADEEVAIEQNIDLKQQGIAVNDEEMLKVSEKIKEIKKQIAVIEQ